MSLDDALKSVWRQAFAESAQSVELDGRKFRVRHTSRNKLLQIDFAFEGRELRGIEQNPKTKSRWAKLARDGKQVMQFLEGGRYLAVVVDGEVIFYGKLKGK